MVGYQTQIHWEASACRSVEGWVQQEAYVDGHGGWFLVGWQVPGGGRQVASSSTHPQYSFPIQWSGVECGEEGKARVNLWCVCV